MAIITDWTDPIGGLGSAMSYMTMDLPDTDTVYTNKYPQPLPNTYITIYAEATATLTAAATFDLYGTYDGTNYVKLVDGIIASSNLASPAVGVFNLGQYSAVGYKIAVITADDETLKDISLYLVFPRGL